MKSYNDFKKDKETRELLKNEHIEVTDEPIIIYEKDTVLTIGERIAKFMLEMLLIIGGIGGLCALMLFLSNKL